MTLKDIETHIEALIFASDDGISFGDIREVLVQTFNLDLSEYLLQKHIDNIHTKYTQPQYPMELKVLNAHYYFLTKPRFHNLIQNFISHKDKKKLSQAALETLAIIAYRQPITKLEVEQIRGVNCDYSIQRLLEKNLVVILGKADTVGRPLLYGTSDYFLNYFGLGHFSDLPSMKEITDESNTIGNSSPS